MPYSAICLGCWFFDKHSEEKNRCAAGEPGGCPVSPPQWGPGVMPWNILAILHSKYSKHCHRGSATTNGDESLHQKSTLLRVLGSEFGIPNWYTDFKIAQDTPMVTVTEYYAI